MTFNAAVAEAKRLQAQMALEAGIPLQERILRGMLPTPSHLAQQIARCVGRLLDADKAIHYCEPFMGTGPFYSALRWVLPREAIASATGIEIDGESARAAATLWGG
ncbi:MAG: SAM-dependent DNA methyltransferase, partial [Planctomycetota bacterium]|nr:SAM-dependent DNA methyltransferase [Planctomycetota bacterium]